MATDAYGQGIQIADLTAPPNAAVLATNLGAVIPQTIMRFASASARAATLTGATAPVEGMVSWLQDTDGLQVYNGTTWVPIPYGQNNSSQVTSGSSTTTTEITTSLAVTLATRAGVTYELVASGLIRSSVAGDRVDLRIRRGTTTGATQVGGGVGIIALGGTGQSCTAQGIDTPGAGSTTWTVFVARAQGTGNADLTASASLPAVFTVREL